MLSHNALVDEDSIVVVPRRHTYGSAGATAARRHVGIVVANDAAGFE